MKRNLGTVLSALFGAALLFGSPFGAEPARATDLRAVGGSGGNDYRFEGNAPGYVVGFQGKMGAWIDQLQIVCAGWDANAVSLLQGEPSEAVGDSTGGEPGSELCPEGWAIVETAIQVQREPLVLHSVVFKCRPVSGGGEVVSRSFGSTEEIGGFRVSAIVEACPEGEMMSGFHGRSGEYVDAFGMICGPSPENRVSDADKAGKGPVIGSSEKVTDVDKAGEGPVVGSSDHVTDAIKKGPVIAGTDPAEPSEPAEPTEPANAGGFALDCLGGGGMRAKANGRRRQHQVRRRCSRQRRGGARARRMRLGGPRFRRGRAADARL